MNFNLKDLIKESINLFEGRKEDARAKYTGVPEEIFNIFVSDDPSDNQKYINWLMKVWEADQCQYSSYRCRSVPTANKLMENITFFHEKTHKYDYKDINQINHISTLNNDTVEAKLKLTKGELKKQATKFYETDRYLVIEPHSHASSCYYGGGTQWCTTSRNYSGHFNNYYKTNSLLYFINKKTGKKRAFLTSLKNPMFGPRRYNNGATWFHAGQKEYNNYSGEIYTETDRLGRSFAGIPLEAREAMQKAHVEKAKKNAKELKDGSEKIKLMQQLGMEDIPEMTTLNGNWSVGDNGPIPKSVKEITGTFQVNSNDDFGNVEKVKVLALNENVNVVNSIKTCEKISIRSRVNLNSIEGTVNMIDINNGVITNWGGITSVNKLISRDIQRGWKTMVDRMEINELGFTSQSAKSYLEKAFKDKAITVSNYFY